MIFGTRLAISDNLIIAHKPCQIAIEGAGKPDKGGEGGEHVDHQQRQGQKQDVPENDKALAEKKCDIHEKAHVLRKEKNLARIANAVNVTHWLSVFNHFNVSQFVRNSQMCHSITQLFPMSLSLSIVRRVTYVNEGSAVQPRHSVSVSLQCSLKKMLKSKVAHKLSE